MMFKLLTAIMLSALLLGCTTVSDHQSEFTLTVNVNNKSMCDEGNIKLYTYVKGSLTQNPQTKRALSGFYFDSNRRLNLKFTHGWGEKSGLLVREQTKLIVIELHCGTTVWSKAFKIENQTNNTNEIELVWN